MDEGVADKEQDLRHRHGSLGRERCDLGADPHRLLVLAADRVWIIYPIVKGWLRLAERREVS